MIFQGGLHQCPSEKGAKASRLLASTSRSLVTSRLTLPANAGHLRLLPPKTLVRETRRRRKKDSNPRSLFTAQSVFFAELRCLEVETGQFEPLFLSGRTESSNPSSSAGESGLKVARRPPNDFPLQAAHTRIRVTGNSF